MSKDYDKTFASRIDEFNVLGRLAEAGMSPEQIRSFCIQTLSPYLDSQRLITTQADGMLAQLVIKLIGIQARPASKAMLDEVMALRVFCVGHFPSKTFSVFHQTERLVIEAGKHFGVQAQLELRGKKKLPIRLFAAESLRLLGSLTESSVLPRIREVVGLLRVASCKPLGNYLTQDFGYTVSEIEASGKFASLVRPEPWGIKLNQLRNSPQHFGYGIEGRDIWLEYGSPSQRQRIQFSRDEMLQLLHSIMDRVRVLTTAREIFLWNKIDDLSKYQKFDGEGQDHDWSVTIAAELSTKGFKLKRLIEKAEGVEIDIDDLALATDPTRLAYCEVCMANLAQVFEGRSVRLKYRPLKSFDLLLGILTKEDATRLANAEEPLNILSGMVKWSRQATKRSTRKRSARTGLKSKPTPNFSGPDKADQ